MAAVPPDEIGGRERYEDVHRHSELRAAPSESTRSNLGGGGHPTPIARAAQRHSEARAAIGWGGARRERAAEARGGAVGDAHGGARADGERGGRLDENRSRWEEAGGEGEEEGLISLEHLRLLPTDEVKRYLTSFKGVGPKTVSCVLMFTLGRAEFPVDTHVWHIAKKLRWVPPAATRETTYEHLNRRVPDDLKYDLHVLLVDHGKRCRKCCKDGRLQKESHGDCPLAAATL